MSTSVTWNGTLYSIPAAGERSWANLSNFLIALGTYAQTSTFQKFAMRVATTSPVTVSATTDCVVVCKLSVAGAVAVTLPAGSAGQVFVIVDGTGDAATNNITITPAAGTINGAATYVISQNRGGVALAYSGTEWVAIAEFNSGEIHQGGDSFGATMVIGTNDAQTLALETNGSNRLTIDSSGNMTVDTSTLVVDATNNRVGVANASPAVPLDVTGAAAISGNLAVDTNTLFVDATNNRVGIANGSPAVPLDVTGAAAISGNLAVDTNTLFVDASNNRVGVANGSPSVALDVTGATAISGDLTVDTTTLKVDSSNNRVGIGTASPAVTFHVLGSGGATVGRIEDSAANSTPQMQITNDAGVWILRNDGGASDTFTIRNDFGSPLTVGTASTAGAWTFGATSSDVNHAINNNSTANNTLNIRNHDSTTSSDARSNIVIIKGSTTNTAGNNRFIVFVINAGGTDSGYIGTNGANAAAFFNTSDRRKKKDITDLVDALDKVSALRPVAFNWKEDGSAGVGFIAQEVIDVMPQVVVKTDDGSGDEVGDEPWRMTESGMVPYLVAAIKELKARIQVLEDERNKHHA